MSKVGKLLEFLKSIEEEDKFRSGNFIQADTFKDSEDSEKEHWYKMASRESDEFMKQYYMNRGLGMSHTKAKQAAYNSQRDKFRHKEVDLDAPKHDEEGSYGSGYDSVEGEKEVSLERKEAITNLIKKAKSNFKGDEDLMKVLSLHLVKFGFDEVIPSNQIPYYTEVSKILKDSEDAEDRGKGRGKSTLMSVSTDKIGVSNHAYYKVMSFLKDNAKALQHNESFGGAFKSLFGKPGEEQFKLSNLEPMVDVIKRDIRQAKFKNYGLHLQGVTTEGGEDMLSGVPNIQHQHQGEALVVVLDNKVSIGKILKKAKPGKRVILFGFDSKPQDLRKGFENFPYKVAINPTVIGSYTLSTESKSESLLRSFREGFQCSNYLHSTGGCEYHDQCPWQGFPSVSDDMNRECAEYR